MSDTQQQTLAIEVLVRARCQELGFRPVELVRRCGYQNVSKGLRRLEQLRAGNFKSSVGLVRRLPAALELPVEVVKKAVEKSERYLRDSAWRAAFGPHAIIITERTRPEPLFVAAFIGVDVLLRVDFDLTAAPVTAFGCRTRKLKDGRCAEKTEIIRSQPPCAGFLVGISPNSRIGERLTVPRRQDA